MCALALSAAPMQHMCTRALLAALHVHMKIYVHTHTHSSAYNREEHLYARHFFSLIHMSLRCSSPPPTSLSGRNQWALSSAECDVMQISAVTSPEGEVPGFLAWPVIL